MPTGLIDDQPASAFGHIFQRCDRQVMNTESNLARHVVSRKHEAVLLSVSVRRGLVPESGTAWDL